MAPAAVLVFHLMEVTIKYFYQEAFFNSGSPGLVEDHLANCINSLRENGLNCSDVSLLKL